MILVYRTVNALDYSVLILQMILQENARSIGGNLMGDELRPALELIWGGGIDYATSPDFEKLSPDEKDALYIRYRDNLIAKAEKVINKKATEAVIKKLEELKSKKLHRKVISPKMISIYDEEFVKVSELTEVINQLRASIQEGEHGQGKKTTP